MKKIFYLVLFVLCTFLLVGCDSTTHPFKLKASSVNPYREKIDFNLVLEDEDKLLEKTSIKGTISEIGSKTVKQTKTADFKSKNTDKVSFTGLEPATEYYVEFYASYNGKKEVLLNGNYWTTDNGIPGKPYPISTVKDFNEFVRGEKTGHFELINDIDFDGQNITPLFQSDFLGSFDGNGFSLINFNLYTEIENEDGTKTHDYTPSRDQYYGLFGKIGEGAKISNLNLENFEIHVSRDSSRNNGTYADTRYYYGVLAGECSGEIENVNIFPSKDEHGNPCKDEKGNITSVSAFYVKSENVNTQVFKVGGLVGRLTEKGTIKNCNVELDIFVEGSKDVSVGGIAGTTRGAKLIKNTVDGITETLPNISDSSFTGKIDVKINGYETNDAHITAGGLVGKNASAVIYNCIADVNFNVVSKFEKNYGQGIFVGGLVGKNLSDNSKVDKCTAEASFVVETKDEPKVDEEHKDSKINVYIGYFAGQNGGDDASTRSAITNCTFVNKGENSLTIFDNEEIVKYVFDVVGNEKDGSKVEKSTLPTEEVKINVEKYVPENNTEENEPSDEPTVE